MCKIYAFCIRLYTFFAYWFRNSHVLILFLNFINICQIHSCYVENCF